MSILQKIFGSKAPTPVVPAHTGILRAAAAPDPNGDPNLIKVFDAYGREMLITKQAWHDSVLVDHLKKVWNDPDALCSSIEQSLRDGFGSEMVKPAEQLAAIDPNAERGAVVLAIVYREQKRLVDSENVIRRYIDCHGESASILANLARVQADRGENALSVQTLWRALELDPNEEGGFGWYTAIFREKEGAEAGLEAMRRIAVLPGAWRARIWLARDALDRRDLSAALTLYQEALALAPRPAPVGLLQQMSGDLGQHGHLPEILSIVSPHFDPNIHGLAVGNNLIKAHLDLGQLDAARAIVERLYSFKRPDWQKSLAFWDAEIAKTQVGVAGVGMKAPLKTTTVVIDGPLWLRASSAAAPLRPTKAEHAVIVACLGSSFSRADTSSGEARIQMVDAPGRVSRALPLYLVEQLHLRTDAIGRVLIPWVQQEGQGAFMFCGAAWSNEQAVTQARGGEQPADYVAVLHLDGTSTPWEGTLRFLRTIDGKLLGTTAAAISIEDSQPGFDTLAGALFQLCVAHAQVHPSATPDFYQVPTGPDFGYYQLRLEQALAASLASLNGLATGFLHGERDIILGNIDLCLRHPTNPTPRLVLVQTLAHLKKVHPGLVLEFKDKVALLQKENPLAEPVHGMIQKTLNEVLAV
jgi:tetratricopeptide (TPR) repeat protein